MKLQTKILFASALIGSVAFTSMVFAEDTPLLNANVGVGVTTPLKDLRVEAKAKLEALNAENKAKKEALRVEAKAKMEALKAAEKAKRDEIKKQNEAFVLKMAQDKFAAAIANAETALATATSKIAEAKAAAAAATDRPSFEKARQLFMEARKLLEKSMRPLLSTPKISSTNNIKLMGPRVENQNNNSGGVSAGSQTTVTQ